MGMAHRGWVHGIVKRGWNGVLRKNYKFSEYVQQREVKGSTRGRNNSAI
jgi:hypothetical protein